MSSSEHNFQESDRTKMFVFKDLFGSTSEEFVQSLLLSFNAVVIEIHLSNLLIMDWYMESDIL